MQAFTHAIASTTGYLNHRWNKTWVSIYIRRDTSDVIIDYRSAIVLGSNPPRTKSNLLTVRIMSYYYHIMFHTIAIF